MLDDRYVLFCPVGKEQVISSASNIVSKQVFRLLVFLQKNGYHYKSESSCFMEQRYVAQTEREFNHQRQAEGIAAARAKGVRFGRPPLERTEAFTELYAAWRNQEIFVRYAAKQLGIAPRTFRIWAQECFGA